MTMMFIYVGLISMFIGILSLIFASVIDMIIVTTISRQEMTINISLGIIISASIKIVTETMRIQKKERVKGIMLIVGMHPLPDMIITDIDKSNNILITHELPSYTAHQVHVIPAGIAGIQCIGMYGLNN